jgi:hypothetical protein
MERISATAVIMSIGLPQLLTGLDVEKRQYEEDRREKQHCQILHRKNLCSEAELQTTHLRHRIVVAPKEIFDVAAFWVWKGVIREK